MPVRCGGVGALASGRISQWMGQAIRRRRCGLRAALRKVRARVGEVGQEAGSMFGPGRLYESASDLCDPGNLCDPDNQYELRRFHRRSSPFELDILCCIMDLAMGVQQ